LVKKVAANREFEMEAKFRDAVDVCWQGRLVITCNVDPESIQVMPSLDMSMSDKILALRMWGADGDIDQVDQIKWFGAWNNRSPDENIVHELPAFLNWLLTWEPSPLCVPDPRFGFKSYHHPELKQHADSVSSSASFEEVLHIYLGGWFKQFLNKEKPEWRGTATTLLQEVQNDGFVCHVAKEYNSWKMGRNLMAMVSRKKCFKTANKNGCSVYTFDRETWSDIPEDSEQI
jgi:hypothetical protein